MSVRQCTDLISSRSCFTNTLRCLFHFKLDKVEVHTRYTRKSVSGKLEVAPTTPIIAEDKQQLFLELLMSNDVKVLAVFSTIVTCVTCVTCDICDMQVPFLLLGFLPWTTHATQQKRRLRSQRGQRVAAPCGRSHEATKPSTLRASQRTGNGLWHGPPRR